MAWLVVIIIFLSQYTCLLLHLALCLALDLGRLSLCLSSNLASLSLGLTRHLARLALGLASSVGSGFLDSVRDLLCSTQYMLAF